MRVLYGVTGEGLGHAMRSRVMAEHLRAAGHEVKLVASGRAATYLRRYFDDVQPITGFSIRYARDRVARMRTLIHTGRIAKPVIRESIALYRRAISGFAPDVCLTDFDSFAHVFGKLFDRPVISIDHQHVIDRCEHASSVEQRLRRRDLALVRAVVRAKVPGCRHYVVTSFYFPEIRRDRTTLVGPILRPEVLALAPTIGEHVLVYQTAVATAELVAALHTLPDRFVVYARDAAASAAGNVEIRAFDEDRFLADLASARAVICNGGYTLMSEALHLGKPVLSLPLRHQGEQELNAAYLATLGLGRVMHTLDANAIRSFLATVAPPPRIPCGNERAFTTIDTLLQEVS